MSVKYWQTGRDKGLVVRNVYVPLKLPGLGYADTENKSQRNVYSSSIPLIILTSEMSLTWVTCLKFFKKKLLAKPGAHRISFRILSVISIPVRWPTCQEKHFTIQERCGVYYIFISEVLVSSHFLILKDGTSQKTKKWAENRFNCH